MSLVAENNGSKELIDLSSIVLRRGCLLVSSKKEPMWNMAFDNWLAQRAPLAVGDLVLRLYSWEPAALTIGRNQSWERALNKRELRAGEIAIRRITGGRAIYHDSSEITYAFVYQGDTSDGQLLGPAVVKLLSSLVGEALRLSLQKIGLSAEIERRSQVNVHERSATVNPILVPSCFDSTARHELTVSGVKVGAGAQRVIGSRYFQHGSLKLGGVIGHPALGCDSTTGADQFENGNGVLFNELIAMESFGEVFSVDISQRELSNSEVQEIDCGVEMLEFCKSEATDSSRKEKSAGGAKDRSSDFVLKK